MAGNAAGYDEDFYAWSMQQARLLRNGEFARLDIENIAEELESIGRSDKRQIESRLVVLLTHLPKWQVQVGFRSRSWSAPIREQRRRSASSGAGSDSWYASRRVCSRPSISCLPRHSAKHARGGRNRPRRDRLPGRLPIYR